MSRKLTLDIVKERLKDINPMIEIIDDKYISNETKLKCRCLKEECSDIFYMTWASLKRGSRCPKCVGTKKKTITEVKDELPNFNKDIIILSDEYINSKTKLKCKCTKPECSHEFDMNWNSISNGQGCPKCGRTMKLNIDYIKEESLKKDIEIIDDKYINANTKLNARCLKCNNEWMVKWGTIYMGHGCPKCAGVQKLKLDSIVRELEKKNKNIKIISEKYINSGTKLKFECLLDGHKWKSCWGVVKRGAGCPMCAGVVKRNIFQVKKDLLDINPNISIESNMYKNNKTKLSCKCLTCGNLWITNWTNIQSGKGCPVCKRQGAYSKEQAEKRKDKWKNMSAELYFIKCFDGNEEFLKVGVCRNGVDKRFVKSNMPYKYEVLGLIRDSLYDVVLFESTVLTSVFSMGIKYEPKIKFDGHTECFDISGLEYVKELLAEKVGEINGNE